MRRLIPAGLAALCLLASSLLPHPAVARVWLVPGDAATIQTGISLSEVGDTVQVACGTYQEHDIRLKPGITLRGENGQIGCAVIDAQFLGPALIVDDLSQPIALEGLTLTRGSNSGLRMSGAILPATASLFMRQCRFIDNRNSGLYLYAASVLPHSSIEMADCEIVANLASSGSGGGLYARGLNLEIIRCSFTGNNAAGNGGAASIADAGLAYLDSCSLTSNSALNGGAVHVAASTLALARCDIRLNSASTHGGALFSSGHSVSAEDCVLSGNLAASNGGGIYTDFCIVDLSGITLHGNSASSGGGLAFRNYTAAALWSSIIAASTAGSAVYADQTSVPVIESTDIFGNAGGDWTGWIADQACQTGNLWREPHFCAAGEGDLALSTLSPCLPRNNASGVLMGALGAACQPEAEFVDDLSWMIETLQGAPPGTERAFGVAIADYDNDGDNDLYIASTLSSSPYGNVNRLLRNEGPPCWQLADVTSTAGVLGADASRAAKWGDYNNDGYLDLYVGNLFTRNHLFRSNGPPYWTLTDVALAAGVQDLVDQTEDAAWVDYDNDGYLDLCVAREVGAPHLYRNQGPPNWTFIDRAATAGLTAAGDFVSVSFADYDNDGDADLFLVNGSAATPAPSRLYRNNGNGTFTDVTPPSLADAGQQKTGSAWGDFDGDGYLDLFVAGYYDAVSSYGVNRLYRNLGAPSYEFQDMAAARGVVYPECHARSAAWLDYDNDGDLDLYVGDYNEDHLYRNEDGFFTDVTAGSALADFRSARGVAHGDLDNDGRLDLFQANYEGSARLFQNRCSAPNHWLQLKLNKQTPTGVDRAVIGARVSVTAGDRTQIREVSGGSGYFSQCSPVLHFGLGSATAVERVEVRWPGGGMTQVFAIALVDTIFTVEEGVTDVAEERVAGLSLDGFGLLQPFPNPFNARTVLRFSLPPGGSWLRLAVYDARGRLVRTLAEGYWPEGAHSLTWTGEGRRGALVPSGLYFCRLQAAGRSWIEKLVLAK